MPTPPPVADSLQAVIWLIGGIQILWGLFLLVLTFAIKRLVKDLDENTDATNKLAESLAKLNLEMTTNLHALNLGLVSNFVNKTDWEYVRGRLHELGDRVQGLVTKESLREQMESKNRG